MTGEARRTAWALFGLGVVVHAGWALTQGVPTEMDAQYYELVAGHVARGEGAVTASTWSQAYALGAGPQPADLHWMPLPSRVTVPGLWLAPWGGRATGVLLAALWGPLAFLLARRLDSRLPALAGALALCGGVYARLMTSTDCYALYGVIGGLAWLAAADRRAGLAVLAGALAALTRNDGLLLSPVLALAFAGPQRAMVAAAGPLTAAGWAWRCWSLGGASWLAARGLVSGTANYVVMFDGVARDLVGPAGRLGYLAGAWQAVLEAWLTPGLLVLTVPAALGAWRRRDLPWVRAAVLYVVVVPILAILAAPAVATHGTLYRTGAATLGVQLALASIGLDELADRAEKARGYPRLFTLGVLAGSFVFLSLAMGALQAKKPARASECALVAGLPPGPVLTSRPLEMELRCDRPGVMVSRAMDAAMVRGLADKHGAVGIVAAPVGYQDEASVGVEQVNAWLPDWGGADQLRTPPR